MSKRESIARYNLIIKKLRKQPADFEQISTLHIPEHTHPLIPVELSLQEQQ